MVTLSQVKPARIVAVPVSCDFCLAKCERIVSAPPVIAESRRLCVRIGHIESRMKGQRVTDRQPEQSDGDTAMSEAGCL
ncbi:MAG: hypothetical protein PUD20_07960 [bacterium]|nr:hypothetical protein [bacterium]